MWRQSWTPNARSTRAHVAPPRCKFGAIENTKGATGALFLLRKKMARTNLPGQGAFSESQGEIRKLPVRRAFFGKGMYQEVNESTDLRLCKTAGRVDGIDALCLHWQVRNGLFYQALLHRVGVKETWQVSDTQTGLCRIQQRLTIIYRQPARCAYLALFTGRCGQFPNRAVGLARVMQQLVVIEIVNLFRTAIFFEIGWRCDHTFCGLSQLTGSECTVF
mmetsp:Transcript_27056/g.49204  ORF Transcript_27056/g.49204 Transcript_27056/m.49204 type:complete len:219 (-) Transcript_27056:901-1557(-)